LNCVVLKCGCHVLEIESCLHSVLCIALLCCHDQGDGSNFDITDASKAIDVFLGTGVYAITIGAGVWSTCATLSNKQVLCWGNNRYGKPNKICG
jgi:hypothetical protein